MHTIKIYRMCIRIYIYIYIYIHTHTYIHLVGCVFVSYLGNIAWWPWAKIVLVAPSPCNLQTIKG